MTAHAAGRVALDQPARWRSTTGARSTAAPRHARPASAQAARRGRRRDGRRDRRERRAGLRHQHRLRQARQRRASPTAISPRCSATSCSRTPPASASRCPSRSSRLMMALKLASLAQGASGVRWATLEQLLEHARARHHAGHSGARLGRRVGRPRAARPHGGGADRRRRGLARRRAHAGRRRRSPQPGLAPLALGPKEGLALLNGTQFSTAFALAGAVRGGARVPVARWSPARCRPTPPRAPTRRSTRASTRCARHRGQIEAAAALRALLAGSAIRAFAPVDDDRVQDPYCLRCQPQVMGAALDLLRHAAATLETEANGVSDNPLVFADDGEVALRRQLPRRAGRLRGRHHRAADLRDRLDLRAARSPCWSIRRCRGLPAFLTPRPGSIPAS